LVSDAILLQVGWVVPVVGQLVMVSWMMVVMILGHL